VTRSRDRGSGRSPNDVEPTVREGHRKRTTADNWPPRAEPGPGRSFGNSRERPLPERSRRVVRLVSVSGDTDLSIELKSGLNKVGRQRNDNHIVLVGPEISRFHAELVVEQDRVVINDLGSANGTYVNDQRVQGSRELNPADLIQFSQQFRFQLLVDISAETPDSMTLPQSREEPLPRTDPPPPDRSAREVVPTSLRRRSQQLKMPSREEAAHEPVDVPPRPRVPALHEPSDVALMEQISEAVIVDTVGRSPDEVELAILERERRQLAVLYQVSKRCMSAEGLAELDRLLINVLERIVSFDRGFISYQLPSGDWKLVMSPKGDRWERKVVRSLLQKALKSRRPTLVRDSRGDDSLGAPIPGRTDARLLLPLVARSSPVGTVFLISSQHDSFDDHTVDFLALFADIAALSVVNCARLESGG